MLDNVRGLLERDPLPVRYWSMGTSGGCTVSASYRAI